VLLFYLVARTYPVPGRSVEDICAAHQEGRRILLADVRPDLPSAFVAVVERALSRQPADRYQSAGAMLRDLSSAAPAVREPAAGAAGRSAALPAVWRAAAYVAGALVLVTALGYFTSAAFNAHFGITRDFASEGMLTYARLGAQNLVPTLVYMGAAVLLFFVANAVFTAARAFLPGVGTMTRRLGAAWTGRAGRRAAVDPAAVARTFCAAGTIAFAVIAWTFRDVVAGVTSYVDDAPPEALAILHPSHITRHVLYGLSLDMLVLMMIVVLRRVLRGAGGRPPAGPVLGLCVLAALGLVFHAIAWRVLYKNEFRQATFAGQTCYVLAARGEELLVHCPRSAPPRNRVVARGDPALALTGRVEQVSNAFGPRSPDRGPD
jgi:hypothetical protein